MATKACTSQPSGECLECKKVNYGKFALRCNSCSLFCHFECSLLPVYQLARYVKTRVSFICRKCVMNEKWFKECAEVVQDVAESEGIQTRPNAIASLGQRARALPPSTPSTPACPNAVQNHTPPPFLYTCTPQERSRR
jgi:hypothetical protein